MQFSFLLQLVQGLVQVFAKMTRLQWLQKWDEEIQKSSKGRNYRLFKSTISYENYFKILPKQN